MTTRSVRLELDQDEIERQQTVDEAIAGWRLTGRKLALSQIRTNVQKVGSLFLPDDSKREKRGRLCRVVAAGPEATVPVGTWAYCGTYDGVVIDVGKAGLTGVLIVEESELSLIEDDGHREIELPDPNPVFRAGQ